ncbi:hypothetical protein J6590_017192 [Homalodisca vitripennis]|nr:hypothetical protein J6590_017192 [Homalodisca vitripennis]
MDWEARTCTVLYQVYIYSFLRKTITEGWPVLIPDVLDNFTGAWDLRGPGPGPAMCLFEGTVSPNERAQTKAATRVAR